MTTNQIKQQPEKTVHPKPSVLSVDKDITKVDKNKAMCDIISSF